jgi:hypothetical protein
MKDIIEVTRLAQLPDGQIAQVTQRAETKRFIRGKYQPGRGGHAPGHLHDAFCAAVDAYEDWEDGQPVPTVGVGDLDVPMQVDAVFGLLWNCRDIMPSMLCQQIDNLLPYPENCGAGSTYAQGARHMKHLIVKAAGGAS